MPPDGTSAASAPIVYVSGTPGSGKSTIARPLAQQLGFSLLSKDVIKEQLFDSLGPSAQDPHDWSRVLGRAAMELIWRLATFAPQVVLEANFRPHSLLERTALSGLGRRLVEVYCDCPPALAATRYAARSARPERHAGAHPLRELSPAMLAEFDGPVGIGELVVVDTSRPVDIDELSALLRPKLR